MRLDPQANLRNWNEGAFVHVLDAIGFYQVDRLLGGADTLFPAESEERLVTSRARPSITFNVTLAWMPFRWPAAEPTRDRSRFLPCRNRGGSGLRFPERS
jgi:hypothetical protein